MIKVFDMFAGYGGAEFALKKAGIEHECVGVSEIDKYAMQCFTQNHKGFHYGDCTKINPNDLPDFDLLTGGFPCQSFSVAGKGLGELDTRGTLFNEIIRIANIKQPRYMMLENVKGLTFKSHKTTFEKILSELKRIGYNVQWKVLNSKEYGIPQNRERVFFVCFRKDLDINFEFPEKEELKIFLKDILEREVDERYYLKQEQVERLLIRTETIINSKEPEIFDIYNKKIIENGTCPTLSDPCHNNLRLVETKCVAMRSYPRTGTKEQDGERHQRIEPRKDGCTNTLTAVQKDNLIQEPKIQIKNATNKGYIEATIGDGISLEQPNSKTRRGRVQDQISPTLDCKDQRGVLTPNFRIRKLTPKECFRLMGFFNDEIDLEGLSNTQRYKLAGNGWDINLVSKIFKEMFK